MTHASAISIPARNQKIANDNAPQIGVYRATVISPLVRRIASLFAM